MDKYNFTLRTDLTELNGKPIGRFDAFFPDVDKDNKPVNRDDIPAYVNIEGAVFKRNFNGGNYSVFIAPGILDESSKNNPREINVDTSCKRIFFWYRINHDKSQSRAFYALLIAAVGVCIDSTFAIGKVYPLIHVSKSQTIVLLSVAMGLKIIGLWTVFKKGFWDAK